MEVITEEREMTITDKDGVAHKVMGKVTITKDGFDEDGNLKQSVNISVPPFEVGAVPGKVE